MSQVLPFFFASESEDKSVRVAEATAAFMHVARVMGLFLDGGLIEQEADDGWLYTQHMKAH